MFARVNGEFVLTKRHAVVSFKFRVEKILKLGEVDVLPLDYLPLYFPRTSASRGLSSSGLLGFVARFVSEAASQRDIEVLNDSEGGSSYVVGILNSCLLRSIAIDIFF